MWLEITGSCQLRCSHCYASSGPGKGHGNISTQHWKRILEDAQVSGIVRIQFIGGEPTVHPDLPELITHALEIGLKVEVFSNMFSIRESVWQAFSQQGVTVATSYYSANLNFHDEIANRVGSHTRTRANIAEAVVRGIPLRIGLIKMSDDQDIQGAIEDLAGLGVPRESVRVDDQRGVGRGEEVDTCQPEDELCGQCADGVIAVLPDGSVQPCVFSRDPKFQVGNITDGSLSSVLVGDRLSAVRDSLTTRFVERGLIGVDCPPADPAGVQGCNPACSPSCVPTGSCNPVVNPPPCNPLAGHPPRPEPTPRPPGPVCPPY